MGLLSDSRVLVNASWVEVQSLVDLEAAAMGCCVVASPAGHTVEWLGRGVREVPGSMDQILDVALEQARTTEPPPKLDYRWTWEDAAAALDRVYRQTGDRIR